MTNFDVFNGDADGLCALQQVRLAEPRESRLVTGVKRDNALLQHVRAIAGDSVTVLDLSLTHNLSALNSLLKLGVSIEYFDHHHTVENPQHPLLHLVIDASPDTCTSILVDHYLGGHYRSWAVVGAFGDNMPESAQKLADSLSLRKEEVQRLKQLGECLNYNSYGDKESDLMYPPAQLYRLMQPFADPLQFIEQVDDFAYVFVTYLHWHGDCVLRPGIPVPDMHVSTTDSCFLNFDQDVVVAYFRSFEPR